MNIIDTLRGLHYVGWKNNFLALTFGLKKLASDRQYQASRPKSLEAKGPGALKTAAVLESSVKLEFEHRELDLTFLAPDLVRVTWQPGILPVPYGLAARDWSSCEFKARDTGSGWKISTSALTVEVDEKGGISFKDPDGSLVRRDNPPEFKAEGWTLRAPLTVEEKIFGLGEKNSALDLRVGSYRMWNTEAMGSYGQGTDPIYLNIPVYMGLNTSGGYMVFFENSFESRFTFGDEAVADFSGGALRYYFIFGQPAEALERYTQLTGRHPLPPRWSLGYHQARWSYKTEEEVREIAQGFEERKLPLSVIHLDIHYMDGYRVFTVDPARFPDLASLSRDMEAKGIKLITIIDPGVKADPRYQVFREGLENNYFCKDIYGKDATGPVWPGTCGFPDFTNPKVRQWWADKYTCFADWGISGVWHDMNEPAVFSPFGEPTLPRSTRHDMDGRGGEHQEAHNVYGLLEVRSGFNGLKKANPNKRPWLLTRSGWAGIQRYSWTWTGDNEASWWSLRQSMIHVMGLGLIGVPFSGPDIGGFSGEPDEQLYVRWFQIASFLPFFRTHSAVFRKRREPWLYSDAAVDICRDFLELRYKLLPYYYTLAWETSRTGTPVVRPMLWLNPRDPSLWSHEDQFLLGNDVLVAPVVVPDRNTREVFLPEGRWYCLWDNAEEYGPATVSSNSPIGRIPVFFRGGAIIPMEENHGLVLKVYLDKDGAAKGSLYQDEGDGYGSHRMDEFQAVTDSTGLTLTAQTQGEFKPGYKTLEVEVHGTEISSARVDGEFVEVRGNRFTCKPFSRIEMNS